MRVKPFMGLVVFLTSLLILTACSGRNGSPPLGDRPDPPPEYQDLKNPVAGDNASANTGKEIYNINCASCHGDTGLGDGPIGASLDPEPGNLAESQKKLSDGYLYWRIADGGILEPFNSAMPSWKGALNDEQIWEVITYLRTLGN